MALLVEVSKADRLDRWELTPDELVEASILPDLLHKRLSTLRAEIALERLSLSYADNDLTVRVAWCQAQYDLLSDLLLGHDEAIAIRSTHQF